MTETTLLLSAVKAALDGKLSPSNAWKKIEHRAKAWAGAGHPMAAEAPSTSDDATRALYRPVNELKVIDLRRDQVASAEEIEKAVNAVLAEGGWELYQFLGGRILFTRRKV